MARNGGTGQKTFDAAGNVGSGVATSALTWLITSLGISLDPALAKLLAVVGFVVGVAFALVYKRYAAIITRRGPHERAAYDTLRQSLALGGLPARVYSERLRATLDAVDRFFGDAGVADRTLWPRAFGLRTPAPLWTAPAFERCLLLASIYPVVTILIIWSTSGHVGPAEHALGLREGLPGWQRGGIFAVLLLSAYTVWRLLRATTIWAVVLCLAALAFVIIGAFFISSVVCGAAAIGFIVVCTRAVAGAVVAVVIVAGAVVVIGFGAVGGVVVGAVGGAVGGAVIFAFIRAVKSLNGRSIKGQWQGRFQATLLAILTAACLAAAATLGQTVGWRDGGPVLLILGLLTLINAPFDWASLGLTRALLRRGLEMGGWWPYALALVDALAAACIIALLTIVAVLGVQAYDALAAFSGGDKARILPLNDLLDGIEASPAAPEFWWVYAMLLSTMIPSLVNLTISGASLLRGVPWVTKLLLLLMPERGAPPSFNRPWITVLLTLQVFVGAAIGIIAQGLLACLVIWWLLPPFGLDLLDLARAVAAPDLPGQAIAAVVGLF